jgi:hypothetical protein
MRFITGKVMFLCCLLAGAATFVAAQEQQAPPPGQGPGPGAGGRAAGPPQNIKVLPKDWTRPQIQQLMQTFVESLGVGAPGEACGHCHTVDPRAPPPPAGRGPQFDFALDDNPNKDIARKMIQMVMAVNADSLKDIGEPTPKEKVTCYTCHHGKEQPAVAPPNGWARGNFTLIPPGPTVPPRRGGPGGPPAPAGGPGAPGGAGAPADPATPRGGN